MVVKCRNIKRSGPGSETREYRSAARNETRKFDQSAKVIKVGERIAWPCDVVGITWGIWRRDTSYGKSIDVDVAHSRASATRQQA